LPTLANISTNTYDAFGNGGAIEYSSLGYTGEYHDPETGFIYLRARYYDPTIGRFASEDPHWNLDNMIYGDPEESETLELAPKAPSYIAIAQSTNLYPYCANNPLKFIDTNGKTASTVLGGAWGFGASAATIDGPFPYGDIVGLVIGVGGTIVAGGIWIYDTITNQISQEKASSTTDTISGTKTDNPNDIIIYRTGSGNATNLTPRDVDTTGLSYSTIKPQSGSYTVTSIDTINSTGVLRAEQDGTTHVSVSPIDPSTMQGWIDSRENASTNPHEYTILLQSISVKIK